MIQGNRESLNYLTLKSERGFSARRILLGQVPGSARFALAPGYLFSHLRRLL